MAAVIAGLVGRALEIYYWIIIVEVILSWVPRRHGEPRWLMAVREFVDAVTEPYLGLFRRFIPVIGAGGVGIDLSPLVGLLVLGFLRPFLVRLVFEILSLVLP